jgi:YYY domain-containing protein
MYIFSVHKDSKKVLSEIMNEIIFIGIWWFVLELIGFIVLPITIFMSRNLFDKGYSISKILGIVLLTYLSYVFGRYGIVVFDFITIILTMLLILCLSFFLLIYKNTSKKIVPILKSKDFRKIILITDTIFTIFFLLFILVRSLDPDINGGEAPMDLAYINSAIRSEKLPPPYPWYSGKTLEECYYYFGHLAVAVLTILSNIPSSITYNLALCTFLALLASASFGIGFNLTKKYSIGLLTLFMIVFMANFFSFIHIINSIFPSMNFYIHCYGQMKTGSFFDRLVAGGSGSLFWCAVRVIPMSITEFPWYSFIWGDLHAHYVSFSFIMLSLFLCLNIFKSKKFGFNIFGDVFLEKIIYILVFSVCLGFLFPQLVWNYPIFVAFFSLVILIQQYLNVRKFKKRFIIKSFIICLIIIFLSFAFYISSYVGINSNYSNWLNIEEFKTSIYHFLIVFPNFLLIFIYLIYNIFKIPIFRKKSVRIVSYFLLILWLIIIVYLYFDFFSRPKEFFSGFRPLTLKSFLFNFQLLVLLVPTIAFSLVLIFKKNLLEENQKFVILMILMGALLILFFEIFNTYGRYIIIFKLFSSIWVFWNVSSAYIIYEFIHKFKNLKNKLKIFFIALVIILFMSSPIYLIIATYCETGGFNYIYSRKELTIDGTNFIYLTHESDYYAIQWINKNIKGNPIILENPGKSYVYSSRISTYTGLPTLAGWNDHAAQVSHDDILSRSLDVNATYNTINNNEALELIKKYGIEYIYVGDFEHVLYNKDGLDKFSKYPEYYDLIYNYSNVQIYRVNIQSVNESFKPYFKSIQ